MRSGLVIIIEVFGQNMTQVIFIDDDQVVQTLSPDTADDPFGKRILKGARRALTTCSILYLQRGLGNTRRKCCRDRAASIWEPHHRERLR
jgi:hypothetical protein